MSAGLYVYISSGGYKRKSGDSWIPWQLIPSSIFKAKIVASTGVSDSSPPPLFLTYEGQDSLLISR